MKLLNNHDIPENPEYGAMIDPTPPFLTPVLMDIRGEILQQTYNHFILW
jgi:hypothetical protein